MVDGNPVRWESPYNKVGKQDEFVLGADYSYNFLPTYKAWAAYAHSIYQPTGSDGIDVHGNLFNTGISGTIGRVSFNVEGFWVEPKYDPFVIKTERPSDVQSPGLFYELPISQRMRIAGNSMMQRSIHKTEKVYDCTLTIHFREYFLLQGFLQTWIIYNRLKVQGQTTFKSLVL